MRNPRKIRYIETKNNGKFEVPMKSNTRSIQKLYNNYEERLDFEKYMNPKGLKPTITSRFKKPQESMDFISTEMLLMRSPKPYDDQTVCFRTDNHLSKPEIKQYLTKLYNMPINKIGTFRKQGEIKSNPNRTKFRKKDWKKAIVRVDYEVDTDFQKNL